MCNQCRTLSQGSESQTEGEEGTLTVSTWLIGRKSLLELGKPLLESSYFLIRDVACRSVCILKGGGGRKKAKFVLCIWSFHFCLVNIFFKPQSPFGSIYNPKSYFLGNRSQYIRLTKYQDRKFKMHLKMSHGSRPSYGALELTLRHRIIELHSTLTFSWLNVDGKEQITRPSCFWGLS